MSKVTPEELGRLNITIDFEVSEDIPKNSKGDNILDEEDWQEILIQLYNTGFEIKRRD